MSRYNFKKQKPKRRMNMSSKGTINQISGKVIATKNKTVCYGHTEQIYLREGRYGVRIPRLRMSPEFVVVDLTFPDTIYNRNNVGFNYLSWRYRLGSIFDPDPNFATGSIPGYTNWATMFSEYKVLAVAFSIDICNLESSPVDVFVIPTLQDMGPNITSANELFGNPLCSQSAISSKGGMDRTRLTGTLDLGAFYGNERQYLGDRDYGSKVGANPNQQMVLNVGGTCAALFTVNNGLDVRVTITYTTALYSYNFENA